MAQAGKARGAAVGGSKTQARRVALQQEEKQRARPWVEVQEHRHEAPQLNETGKAWARGELDSDLKPATGLGPAGKVELREAREGLQSLKEEEQRQAEAVLPRELVALRHIMDRDRWQEAVQRWCEQFSRESEDRAFQRGYEAAQGAMCGNKAQGEVQGRAVGSEEQIKVHKQDLGLTGGMAPEPGAEKGIWAELDNLRWRVLRAHQTAEELGERLAGVLLPPEEKEKEPSATPAQKPLSRSSAEVALVAQSVYFVERLLTGLLARLDL